MYFKNKKGRDMMTSKKIRAFMMLASIYPIQLAYMEYQLKGGRLSMREWYEKADLEKRFTLPDYAHKYYIKLHNYIYGTKFKHE